MPLRPSIPRAARFAAILLLGLLDACTQGVDPEPPTLEGEWRITNLATDAVTTLELDQRDDGLTGFWNRGGQAIRVSGTIEPTNEFSLSGMANNQTYVFGAEANDGLSRFEGTLTVYDVRGDVVSRQMIRGERA
jgi:hypothetical protein